MTTSRQEAAGKGAARHAGRARVPDVLADVAHVDARDCAAAAAISISHWMTLVREGKAPAGRCDTARVAPAGGWPTSASGCGKRAEQGAADAQSAEFVTRRAKRASDAAQVKRQAQKTADVARSSEGLA